MGELPGVSCSWTRQWLGTVVDMFLVLKHSKTSQKSFPGYKSLLFAETVLHPCIPMVSGTLLFVLIGIWAKT